MVVSIKQSLIDDVYQMAWDFASKNVIAVRDLRSFAGKLNNLASVIYTLTPFLRQIWGCLSSENLMVEEGLEVDPDEFEQFVIDWADAFWQMPTDPSERRFFVTQFCGAYFVFIRLAQGSRGAPSGWGRMAALLMRLSMGLFYPSEARSQCYVDDPLFALRGVVRP